MAAILNFTCSDLSIGLAARPARSGPESELVADFIERLKSLFANPKHHYALFCEPRLETGFPDIVIVSYNRRVIDEWKYERNNLTTQDLKVLHHLHFIGGGNTEGIEKQLGIGSKNLAMSLERLLSASLIRWYAKQWMPRSLFTRYAVRSIVAVEAKMNDWVSAFHQAELNYWFASESYILSPVKHPQKRILRKSVRLGVGIYSMPAGSNVRKLQTAQCGRLPSSYASWQFNEWIGRRIHA